MQIKAGPSNSSVLGARASQVVEAELDGNVNLYDVARNQVHVLNTTASDIWRLLEGQRSVDEIVKLLADSYAVAPHEIRTHVADMVSTFVELGLLSAD